MKLVPIKPLSVNQAWKGRRFRTDKYKSYALVVKQLLPKMDIPEGNLELHLRFGFSNTLSDFDNPVKPFVDCLQQKYGFNDRMIRRCTIEVVDDVPKGKEFIEFDIKPLKQAA